MAVEIQIRRDTSTDWINANPVLAQGEWGLETDTSNMKIGNGASVWTQLPYQIAPSSVVTQAYVQSASVNAALVSDPRGYASAASTAATASSFLTTQSASVAVESYAFTTAQSASVNAVVQINSADLAGLGDAGVSRQNIHIPALAAALTVATASVVTSAPGALIANGAAASVGSVILLTSQINGAQNGPFVYNGASIAMTRPSDYATGASVLSRTIQVTAGTYANTEWMMGNTSTAIVDTTATTWTLGYSGTNLPLPVGTPSVGEVPTITSTSPLALDWSVASSGDATIITGGTLGASVTVPLAGAAVTQVTGTLSANCTMTITGLSTGCSSTLLLTQGSSPWTLTINGTSVAIPTASGTVFALQLWSPDGSTLYVQPGSSLAYLPLSGGTMSGAIAMGTNAITGLSTDTYTVNTVSVTSNAGTVPVTSKINNFTNSSSAAASVTMATAAAVDGQVSEVRFYDHAAVAETITWINTEANSSAVSASTTSNGSTTSPLSVLFQFNSATTKWRYLATA